MQAFTIGDPQPVPGRTAPLGKRPRRGHFRPWPLRCSISVQMSPIDPSQRRLLAPPNRRGMVSPDKPNADKDAPEPKPSRLDEARRIIAEYANELREIIKKLRRRLN
jgi:hypothetical protein